MMKKILGLIENSIGLKSYLEYIRIIYRYGVLHILGGMIMVFYQPLYYNSTPILIMLTTVISILTILHLEYYGIYSIYTALLVKLLAIFGNSMILYVAIDIIYDTFLECSTSAYVTLICFKSMLTVIILVLLSIDLYRTLKR